MADKEATLIVRLKDQATGALKGLQDAVSGLGIKFIGVSAAVTGFISVLVSSVKAYMENEKAVNRLESALAAQGNQTVATSKDLQKYAEDIARASVFTDEALMATEAFYVTLGFGSEKVKKATQMAADLAATMGWDLQTATMMVGKALSGNETILRRYGLTLEDVNRMHGAASNQLNTLSGRAQNLNNRLDELKEKIGRMLLPTLQAWAGWLEKIVASMEKLAGADDKNLKGRELTIAALQKEADRLATVIQMYDQYGKSNTEAARAAKARFDQVMAAMAREKAALASQGPAKTGATGFAGRASMGEQSAAQKEAEKLAAETQAMLLGLTTKEQARQALSRYYEDAEVARLQMLMSNKEAMELASNLKRNEANKNFAEMEKVQNAALAAANLKYKEEEAKKIKELEERRKKDFVSTLQFIATMSSSSNKTLAAIGKTSAVAIATIDTYTAANKALASAPPPFNFVLMGAVIAAGLANVASISGVALAQGGIVPARPGGTQAILGEGGRAEAVIPLGDRRAQAALGGMGANVGNVYVTVNGVNDPRQIAAKIGHEIIKSIRGQGQIDFQR